jgi:hypothetical protein
MITGALKSQVDQVWNAFWKRNKKVAIKPRPCKGTAGHNLLCPSR